MILVVAAAWLTLLTLVWFATFALWRTFALRERRRRAEALERMRPIALRAVFDDDDPDLDRPSRRDAAALSFLVARLSRQVRGASRERLAAFLNQTGFVDDQLRALGRRGASRRASAAFALGDIGHRRAVPALLERLDDRDRGVRIAAARSLGSLGAGEAAEPLVAALTSERIPWNVGGQALIELGAPAGDALRAAVDTGDDVMRGRAIELLGLVGDARDAPIALDALSDESPSVRERAARALGRLGSGDAAVALEHALGDDEPAVAAAAASSLGRIGAHGSVETLLRHARGDAFEAARASARAASAIDPRAVTAAAEAPGASAHVLEAADLVDIR